LVALGGAAHVFVDDLDSLALADDDHHHLERVLRMRPGQAVTASDGEGGWRLGEWQADGSLAPVGPIERVARPMPIVTVAFAIPKADRPEWAVQKLTEVGVDRIIPLVTARSIVRWDEPKAARNLERLRKVAREAAMQSRRVWLPAVGPVVPVSALTDTDGGGVALAQPGGGPVSLDAPIVLIGPEGGWTDEELEGQRTFGFGPNVLRTETAAVTAGILLTALRAGIVSATS
jgi:16S rRNA (uracil1498-N3)-methyltransferase